MDEQRRVRETKAALEALMKCAIKIKAPFHPSCGFDEISKLTQHRSLSMKRIRQCEVD
jgi:hypothetical protein